MRRLLALVAILVISSAARADTQSLAPEDVGQAISRAVQEAAARHQPAVIAVVDRLGGVLAVYRMAGANPSPVGTGFVQVETNPNGADTGLNGAYVPDSAAAISKAVTAAYLSTAHGNAFSTRTVSQIIQDHFDPGQANTPSGPLFGLQFSQLACSDVNVRADPNQPASLMLGPHRSPLGFAGAPGGFPLYKGGEMVGAVGVAATPSYGLDLNIHVNDGNVDEIIALAATIGLDAPVALRADHITLGGLLLRYSDATASALRSNPGSAPPFESIPAALGALGDVTGYYQAADGLRQGVVYGTPDSGLRPDTSGAFSTVLPPEILVDEHDQPRFPPRAGLGPQAVRGPISRRPSPLALTEVEVTAILRAAYQVALQARSALRQPPGSAATENIAVVDWNGTLLGFIATPDTLVDGADAATQKARSAVFISRRDTAATLAGEPALSPYLAAAERFYGVTVLEGRTAFSTRALALLSRDTFPDGIAGTPNGPFSLPAKSATPFSTGLQLSLVESNILQHVGYIEGQGPDTPVPCTGLAEPVLRDGLQIFAGGFPIYRNGVLIGGIGASGDGDDQSDLTAFLGLWQAAQSLGTGLGNAPAGMRADQLTAFGTSVRYAVCPVAPFLNSDEQNPCLGK